MLILTMLGHLMRREALTSEEALTQLRSERASLGFASDTNYDGLRTVDRQNSALLEFERDARQRAEEAVRTKDDFLLTISHELRTPLTTILGWLEITQADPSSATYERAREAIERSARTQEKLVGQLLDLASFSSGRLTLSTEIFDLNEAAAVSIRNLESDRAARNHELQLAPWPGPLLVRGDQDQIVKAIQAILENAFLYTPSSGRIKFRTIASGSSAILEVEDSGIGIEQEHLPDLFDRFRRNERTVTRRYTGLGLGLTIARAIVDLHGGVIEAASAGTDMGSTFRVRLPLSAVADGDMGKKATEPSPFETLRGRRILIVDDDSGTRDVLAHFLESVGASVLVASSGKTALELSLSVDVDVIVSDIGMPEVSGLELIERLRQEPRTARLRALALSAYTDAGVEGLCKAAGFDDFANKPIRRADLMAKIAVLLRDR